MGDTAALGQQAVGDASCGSSSCAEASESEFFAEPIDASPVAEFAPLGADGDQPIAAFVVGFIGFPYHWAWVVLTTYIVGSGNRGRGDVAYKSMLRVVGAAAGTVVVVVITGHLGGQNPQTVALILTAVFLGIWLRPLGYAWWALFVTLALSLLQGYSGSTATLLLAPRLEEIVIGAIIAVATAWFVLPVKSIMVLRRRLADALGSLQAGLEPDTSDRSANQFQADLTQLRQVLPAFNARRLVTRGRSGQEPADWIDTLTSCETSAVALIKAGSASDSMRHAVRSARRSRKSRPSCNPHSSGSRQSCSRSDPVAINGPVPSVVLLWSPPCDTGCPRG